MKKIFTLFVFVLMFAFTYGQWANMDPVKTKYMERSDKTSQTISVFNHQTNSLKDINANILLEQDFETWPPTGWTLINGTYSTNHWTQSVGDNYGNNGTNLAKVQWQAVTGGQDEWMITPSITVPNAGQPVTIKFDWLMSYYWMVDPNDNADFNVLISDDAGTSWDTLFMEGDSAMVAAAGISVWPWETYEWYTAYLNITAYAGSDVQIAFQYVGNDGANAYVDNLMVYEVPQNDIRISSIGTDWYSYGAYHQIPYKFQLGVVNWAWAQNVGTADATNVSLTVDVNDGTTSIYNKTSNIVSTLTNMQTDSLGFVWGGAYDSIFVCNDPMATNINELKDYTMTFDLNLDQTDEFPTDNSVAFEFSSTNEVYARDNDNPGFRSISPQNWVGHGEDGDIFGVRYDILDTCTAFSISFHVSQYSDTAVTVRGALFMSDGAGSYSDLLWTEMYDITTADLGNWVTLPFNLDGFSEHLDPATETSYLAGLEIYFNGLDFGVSEDNVTPQSIYSTIWKFVSETDWYAITNYSETPFIRLGIVPTLTGINESGAKEQMVNVFPNPTGGSLYISNAENAKVEVYNIMGEMVTSMNNINNSIDISDLSDGNYIIKIIADDFTTARKITLIK